MTSDHIVGPDQLLYSHRSMIAQSAVAWCRNDGISIKHPINLVAALDALGFIDRDAVRRSYSAIILAGSEGGGGKLERRDGD